MSENKLQWKKLSKVNEYGENLSGYWFLYKYGSEPDVPYLAKIFYRDGDSNMDYKTVNGECPSHVPYTVGVPDVWGIRWKDIKNNIIYMKDNKPEYGKLIYLMMPYECFDPDNDPFSDKMRTFYNQYIGNFKPYEWESIEGTKNKKDSIISIEIKKSDDDKNTVSVRNRKVSSFNSTSDESMDDLRWCYLPNLPSE